MKFCSFLMAGVIAAILIAVSPLYVTAAGRGEVVWLTATEPPTLDPIAQIDSATSVITRQLFEGLMWFTPDNVLEPLLATSYTVSDNGLIYTFNLRQGVYFHDGTPFTAEAVKLSFDRLLDLDNSSPSAFVLEMIDEVVVVDTYIVDIVLGFPFAPFTAHLANHAGFIVSPAAMAEAATGGRTINENPIGTGPFVFAYRVSQDYTRLRPNQNHWRATPAHDVIFHVESDSWTRLDMLATGEAHAMQASIFHIFDLEHMPYVDLQRVQSPTMMYIGFQTQQDGPLSDARVRRAITMAINTVDIFYDVREGVGELAVGPVRDGLIAHAPKDVPELPFDPDTAREILAEAGFPDGFSTSIWVSDSAINWYMAELIQANLAAISISVDIYILEWGTFLEQTTEGLHDMFILGWSTLTGDADYGIFPLFHSGEIGGANRSFYDNPIVDDLLERARTSLDPAERDVLYREITEILVYDAPVIFLYHSDTIVATSGIDGIYFDFTVTPHFFNVTLREQPTFNDSDESVYFPAVSRFASILLYIMENL